MRASRFSRSCLLVGLIGVGSGCQFDRPRDIAPADAATAGFVVEPIPGAWVRVGESVDVAVRILREPGFEEPIALNLVGAPTGVTAASAIIPAGAVGGQLRIDVALAAGSPGETVDLTIVADAGHGTRDASARLRLKGGVGALDQTFGVLGIAATSSGTYGGYLRLGNRHLVATENRVYAFDETGVVDAAFATGGVLTVAPDGLDASMPRRAFLVPSTAGRFKVVVAGDIDRGSGVSLGGAVLQFSDTGVPDPAFPERGFALPGSFTVNVVVAGADGALYVAGDHDTGVEVEGAVARLLPSGFRDTAFGPQGYLRWAGAIVTAVSAADPRVVIAVAGATTTHLYGVDVHGAPDAGFGANGDVAVDDLIGLPGCGLLAGHLSPAPANGLWVGGLTCLGASSRGALVRLTGAGAADSTFAGDGVWLGVSDELGSVHGVARLPDGTLIVIGTPRANASQTTLYHLRADGTHLIDVDPSGARDIGVASGIPTTPMVDIDLPYIYIAGPLAGRAAVARAWY